MMRKIDLNVVFIDLHWRKGLSEKLLKNALQNSKLKIV